MDVEKTYTLEDLREFAFEGTPLAVVGHPVAHSISPQMHNAALDKLRESDRRFAGWGYFRFDIPAEDLPVALPLFHKKSFLGLNLTIPHKVMAVDCVGAVSADAERMGAVNTLVWDEFNYDGFNTDGYGLKRALQADLGVELAGTDVVLLGSGGAARAAAVQCLNDRCGTLWIGNRSPERLSGLMDVLRELPGGDRVRSFALADGPPSLPENGVLVNATSAGLKADDPPPLDPSLLPRGWRVYDMIYNPSTTRLLEEAARAGLPAANGLSMLIYQGVRSLEIWTRAEVKARDMAGAACRALELPPRNYD